MTPPDPARAARLTAALADANQQLEQAEQQRDAAHAALKAHGRHEYRCSMHGCVCGLDAALAASAPQKETRQHVEHCPAHPINAICICDPAPAQETERGR